MKRHFVVMALAAGLISMQSCTNSKKTIWVSGAKTQCASGAGKAMCLNVYKGSNVNEASNWEPFYAPIQGFQFEPGYMQKIKVSEEKLPASQVPADASNIKYTMMEQLEKVPDNRAMSEGSWVLVKINGGPLNRKVVVPTINMDLSMKRISGMDGCNNFTADIKHLNQTEVNFGPFAGTKKMCVDMDIADQFNSAISSITNYKIDGGKLVFMNPSGQEVLTFIKNNNGEAAAMDLNNDWTAVRVNGHPINRSTPTPTLNINLNNKTVAGFNSCNNFSGKISTVTTSALTFGPLAVTERYCRNMEEGQEFNKAMAAVKGYKYDKNMLLLLDNSGNELLAFVLSRQ